MEEILDLYELQYSDLMALLANQTPQSPAEIERLQLISQSILENLGPDGAGLLSIGSVPKADTLRSTLLPLARKLALLNNDDRKRILKEHNLGSDVPLKNVDRIVSAFAMQIRYGNEYGFQNVGNEVGDGEIKQLGSAFRQLGFCMMELGLCLARVCDKLIDGCELERSLLQSGSAKGRLIHYHSITDNLLIKQAANRSRHARTGKVNAKEDVDDGKLDLWQQWHYDYGIFTILTVPMFMVSNGIDAQESESPSGHMNLQVYHPKTKQVHMVRASKGSFIVQVGESADVLSKGRLRATLHSVCRLAKMDNLSRETFVVFLQPSWSKTFSLSGYPIEHLTSDDKDSESCNDKTRGVKIGSNGLTQNINDIVPPLSSRLQDGMTFAEFSRQTTKQYYGGSGLQPNR